MSFPKALPVLLVASILVAACGYTMTARSDEPGRTTVAVPEFDNRTFEPYVETRVTTRVKSRLVSSGPWRVVNDPQRAALVIHGAITGFGVTTVAFDANNQPLEQRVFITADITTESKSAAPLRVMVTGTAEYTQDSDSLQTRAAKNRAIEEAGDNLAETLIARLELHLMSQEHAATPEAAGEPSAP